MAVAEQAKLAEKGITPRPQRGRGFVRSNRTLPLGDLCVTFFSAIFANSFLGDLCQLGDQHACED
jgi:hypothetical protein